MRRLIRATAGGAAHLMRPRTLGLLAALAVAGAAAVLAWSFMRGTPSYTIEARFASAQGVFPGTPVSLLGVRVGLVRSVQTEGSSVLVTMAIDSSQALPAGVDAQLVEPELLGEPDIELTPGYVGGPRLDSGAMIPEGRTEVPASTDQLLNQLERVLGAVRPSSARQLVEALAADLGGQGAQINSLLGNASTTVSLLAGKGNDLGRLEGELATLTGTLRGHETELASLITAYDTVSNVVVGHQQQLGQAVTQLADASQALAGLLTPNLRPIEQDVAVITTSGRTLDRELGSLDQAINSSVSLFAAAHRAYDPARRWLNLNDQLAPGMTIAVVDGLVRDRLAGVCRRILAHHAAGLGSQAIATLTACGNPSSGYFNPVLGLVTAVVEGLPSSGAAGGTPSLSQAVSSIPGLSPAQRAEVSNALVSPATPSSTGTHPAGSTPKPGTAPSGSGWGSPGGWSSYFGSLVGGQG